MRESSNPVLRNLVKDERQQAAGRQGGFGQGGFGQNGFGQQGGNRQQGAAGWGNFAGAGQAASMGGQSGQQPQYAPQAPAAGRTITIDDVVTKTGMTVGVLAISAIISYFAIIATATTSATGATAYPLASILALVGGIGGLVLVLIATFGRKQDNPAIVLSYAVLEGLFVGAISFVFANLMVVNTNAGVLIMQAVLGTFGVFAGMLVVYKTGAIRVTPRFTRMLFAAMIGVLVLMLGNFIAGFFVDGGLSLRDGGPIAIIFSLVCIAIAAFSFLMDFDQADQLIRAGAPSKAAWGVALGLTVTLVWLYVEILRLLTYFNND